VAALTGSGLGDVLTETAVATLLTHPNGGAKNKPPTAKLIPLINKVETETQLAQARRIAAMALRQPHVERVVIAALRRTQSDNGQPTTDHFPPSSVIEVRQPVTAVILAAGLGSRMGQATKQLLPWGDTTVLGQTLRHVGQSDVTDVLVVSGHEAAKIEAVAAAAGAAAVYNADYATGEMLSSLQTAVRHLPPTCAAVLVLLADQPMVPPAVINQLLTAFAQGKSDLIAPVFGGKRGNPVLIGRRYFAELLALPTDAAPRTLLQRHAARLHLEEVGTDVVLRDLDRLEDYEREKPKK
jgi:molybdenum cofactor cytidylyltransferase